MAGAKSTKSSKRAPAKKLPAPTATKKRASRVAARKPAGASKAEAALREYALTLPGAVEEFPWGHRAMKVNKKIFAVLATEEGGVRVSTKLPRSAAIALTLPFASPTEYGLGKSGWVTAQFNAGEKPPLDLLCAWIEESYRAIAPAKLVAQLG